MTWDKDTHDLFDYDSKSLIRYKTISNVSGRIYRKQNECFFSDARSTYIANEYTDLLITVLKNDSFFSISPELQQVRNGMWHIIKFDIGTNGYELKENDVLKLGRVIIKVKKIGEGEMISKKISSNNLSCSDISDKENACKICCCEDSDAENPLISPCKCIGSMKYIHLQCLKKWLKNKISCRSSGPVTSYFWSDFMCELCKTPLPSIFKYKEQDLDLVSITYPNRPFMILEDIRPDDHEFQILHLIDLASGETANVGRGHDCDIRLSDISVSRNHAKLRFSKGKYFIQDTKSKFGTLLNIKNSVELALNQSLNVQINRTIVKATVKKPFSIKSLCCCPNNAMVNPTLSTFVKDSTREIHFN